jgi:hypothetical protein
MMILHEVVKRAVLISVRLLCQGNARMIHCPIARGKNGGTDPGDDGTGPLAGAGKGPTDGGGVGPARAANFEPV